MSDSNRVALTKQELLVRSLQLATDHAKGLRMLPVVASDDDINREDLKSKLLAMRMIMANALEAYNEFAHSTGAVQFSERYFLAKAK